MQTGERDNSRIKNKEEQPKPNNQAIEDNPAEKRTHTLSDDNHQSTPLRYQAVLQSGEKEHLIIKTCVRQAATHIRLEYIMWRKWSVRFTRVAQMDVAQKVIF